MTYCYVIFGFLAPPDGNGLLALSQSIQTAHPDWQVETHQWDDEIAFPTAGDVVLIGHSFGGHQAVKLAQATDREVKHLFLLDPVVQSWFPFFWMPAFVFNIPSNVNQADCWLKSFGLPPSSPIRNTSTTFVNHWTSGLGHNDIPQNPAIQDQILSLLT